MKRELDGDRDGMIWMTGHTFDAGHREMIAKFMHCVGTKAFAGRHTGVQIQASQLIASAALWKVT